ncbi:thioredoxin family protein [Rhizobium sp. NTR19]|uniref:Thioredoxin family protein n=1 Tax=Neorhizobium turbinariae TaxID=2937795 RepID=A0ABT0IRK1_9HYPH|nr:thioredoxin family protein [Neorhizobium turbinariae]MCK8780509.1 thioredoxin family protein [Neorhizobium turbinariae]
MDIASSGSHPVISREEWLKQRRTLLALEKEETRLRDKVRAARQALPWVKVDKEYLFDTPTGRRPLADLFDGRSQLMIYHFMFGPDWDAGCPGCSFMSDHMDGALPHLNNHDVTYVAVSRAPLDKIEAYKKRMGWRFPWVSSYGSDFNFDFHVSFTPEELAGETIRYNFTDIPREMGHDELPGLSAFYKNAAGEVFHTYSSYARGGEELCATLMILDRAPLGRNETSTLSFVKRHDEYEEKPQGSSCCH